MPKFTDEFIDQVRSANDIVDIIGQRVRLERKGQNLWGLCPFHSKRHLPLVSVRPSRCTIASVAKHTDSLQFLDGDG